MLFLMFTAQFAMIMYHEFLKYLNEISSIRDMYKLF